ncbi:hypothetical protein [Ilumatobacter sp.]|uniref:hypothetical protein n=1 Tax=Ilumatobacter sp. TaxID=1967498 RepID=UPI00375204B1
MASTCRSRHVTSRSVAVLVACTALLSSCFTGERPTVNGCASGEATGSLEIDSVLERFDCVSSEQFTADYTVLTRLGNFTSTAQVVQAPSKRSITINMVRYIYDGESMITCDLSQGTCEGQINEARTSDVLLTSEFYAKAMAARLRADADRRVGDPVASEITQGGQQALCVDIPVTGGTKRYCALESGALAFFDGSDLLIELTGFSPTPDNTAFATS